jgi:antitoxin (DNA-binding transcriptional repressor) of toxin-antitoxin stability system
MPAIEIDEFGAPFSDIIRQALARGETVYIVDGGELISRIVPVQHPHSAIDPEESRKAWEDLRRFSEEISAASPSDASAEDALRDVRREL